MEDKRVTPENLRAMADWLEAHPAFEIPPATITVWAFGGGGSDFKSKIAAMGSFEKQYTDSFVNASVSFGALRLVVSDWRESVCRRVQTGTRHVEAQTVITEEPAHDEPVYEWRCPDSWLHPEAADAKVSD